MRFCKPSGCSLYGPLAKMTPAQLLEILDDNENMDFTILSGVSSEILRRQIKYGKLEKDNIMIKWTFFFNDGNVNSIVHNEEEDQRISEWVDDPVRTLERVAACLLNTWPNSEARWLCRKLASDYYW